jgi:hypothetical protein
MNPMPVPMASRSIRLTVVDGAIAPPPLIFSVIHSVVISDVEVGIRLMKISSVER